VYFGEFEIKGHGINLFIKLLNYKLTYPINFILKNHFVRIKLKGLKPKDWIILFYFL